MNKLNKLGGGIKAAGIVVMVLALTSALVLLAAEKTPVAEAESGFLGVSVRSLDDGEREKLGVKHGVLVAAVEQESAAAKAGIAKGDVILSVNTEKIRDAQTLAAVVRELAPGSAAKIGLWRGNKAIDVKAVLGRLERPKRMKWKVAPMTKVFSSGAYLGITLLEEGRAGEALDCFLNYRERFYARAPATEKQRIDRLIAEARAKAGPD